MKCQVKPNKYLGKANTVVAKIRIWQNRIIFCLLWISPSIKIHLPLISSYTKFFKRGALVFFKPIFKMYFGYKVFIFNVLNKRSALRSTYKTNFFWYPQYLTAPISLYTQIKQQLEPWKTSKPVKILSTNIN